MMLTTYLLTAPKVGLTVMRLVLGVQLMQVAATANGCSFGASVTVQRHWD